MTQRRPVPSVVREMVIVVDERGHLSEHALPHTPFTLRIAASGREMPAGHSWDRLVRVASWAQQVYVLGGMYAADLIAQRLPGAMADLIATDGYSTE